MAKTPYGKLGSQDILSAHLNGLQYAVNNVEDALNLKTTAITGHALAPVTDMDDPTLRYRIYEGSVRSWLVTPSPVIKRNGVVVDTAEYLIQPAYGVIVFHVQQDSAVNITADVTHVSSGSTRLEAIETETAKVSGINTRLGTAEGEIDALQTNLSTVQGDITNLDGRVDTLEANGGGGGASLPYMEELNPDLTWIANSKRGSTLSNQTTAVNVGMGAGTIDAFPFFVEYDLEFDAMRTVTGGGNSTTTNMIAGIYSNKGVAPFELLAETAVYNATTAGEKVNALLAPVTLKRGLYWLARYQSAGIALDGYASKNADGTTHLIPIKRPTDLTIVNENGTNGVLIGVRTANLGALSALPATFPAIGAGATEYLGRDTWGLVWARVK